MTDLLELTVVAAVALVSSAVAAVAGFGVGIVLLPAMIVAFGVRDAVPAMTVILAMTTLARAWVYRDQLSIPVTKWYVAGAIPAVVAGGAVFATVSPGALVRFLGAFLLLIVVFRHTSWGRSARIGLRGIVTVGVATGFLSAIVGLAGVFIAPFFLAYGLVGSGYVGTLALASTIMHAAKLGVYGGYNLLDGRTLLIGLAIGAVTFVGTYVGKRVMGRVPERAFPYIIETALTGSGLLLLIRG